MTTAAGSNTEVQYNDSGVLGASANFTFDSTTNLMTVAGAASVDNLKLDGNTLSSTNTNGAIVITPNGTGAIQADGGGNARGTYAVDLQRVRSASSQVASGDKSVVLGGEDNTASGDRAIAGGYRTVASGSGAIALGYGSDGSNGNNITASGPGALALGYVSQARVGQIVASANGAIAMGSAIGAGNLSDCAIEATAEGSMAVGALGGDWSGVIRTSGPGAFALGHAFGAKILATANGAIAFGTTGKESAGSILGGDITSSGFGSMAHGISFSGTLTASADGSHAEGDSSHATAYASHAGGQLAKADLRGQLARASGSFATIGDAQHSLLTLRWQTTNNTQSELFIDGAGERMTIPTDTTWAFSIYIVARRTDADNESAGWEVKGVIDRNVNTTALVGTVATTTLGDDSSGAWTVSVNADDTNEALRIQVTGQNSKTIRWVASVRLVQVTG